MPTTTTNYSFNKPVVGGDEDAWGGYINGNWDTLDTLLGGVTNAELSILDGATVTTAELNYNDITTLGTVEASKVVTADANGDVTFPDGEKAIFGTGSDLQIFHDGANSFIRDAGTGHLKLNAQEFFVNSADDSQQILAGYVGGATQLFYSNSKKFETTTGGVKVIGDVNVEKTTGNTQIAVTSLDGIGSIEVGGYTNAFIDIKVPNSDDFDTRYGYNALNCAGDYVLQHTGATKLTTRGYGVEVTGEFLADSYNETYVSLSGTTPTVNCENGNVFALSTSGNTTFTFSNPPASGTAYGFVLKLTAGGTHTITYPASVDWAGGTAPDAPASGETDVLVFYTHDGGTTWYGALSIDAAA